MGMAKQSTDGSTSTKAGMAVDNNLSTYSATAASANPWWCGLLRSASQPALKISAGERGLPGVAYWEHHTPWMAQALAVGHGVTMLEVQAWCEPYLTPAPAHTYPHTHSTPLHP